MRAVIAAVAALLVAGCAPSAEPSGSASTSPAATASSSTHSPSQRAFCQQGTPTPIRETGWEVCLPEGVSAEVAKTSDHEFELYSEIAGERLAVARYQVWKAASGKRPDPDGWILLNEQPTEGKALYGRDEVVADGTISGPALDELSALAIDVLLDPANYAWPSS